VGSRTLILQLSWIHRQIEHTFPELSHKKVKGQLPGKDWTVELAQTLNFRLERKGAALAPLATMLVDWEGGEWFRFDRPFLLVFQARARQQPIFVFWVDNAELLQRYVPPAGA
jgi:hypothetical protein